MSTIAIEQGATILQAAKEAEVPIPTLCHLEGISEAAACRLCMVEVEVINKLLPACVTTVSEEMVVHTNSQRLQDYRRMTVELLFSEALLHKDGGCQQLPFAHS